MQRHLLTPDERCVKKLFKVKIPPGTGWSGSGPHSAARGEGPNAEVKAKVLP